MSVGSWVIGSWSLVIGVDFYLVTVGSPVCSRRRRTSAMSAPRAAATGADGRFTFLNVPFGTYTVTETVPAGFRQTAPPAPGTFSVTLAVNSLPPNILFGNQPLAQPRGALGL